MLSSIDRIRHSQIWDLLDQYADIREHLEDILYSMQMLQSQMLSDLEDLSDDFDDLTEEIGNCSKKLIRFKTSPDPSASEYPPELDPSQEIHVPDNDEPCPFFSESDDTPSFPWNHTEDEGRRPAWN